MVTYKFENVHDLVSVIMIDEFTSEGKTITIKKDVNGFLIVEVN